MFLDPMYLLMVLLPGILLSGWASLKTKAAFNKYSKVRNMNGYTGAQAAQLMLREAGITDVKVQPTRGFLSDHYNPMTKTLALSEAVYGTPSIAAVGVACHEAGHAIQHARSYKPLWLRST
ncbi:MAG: zinc metallopeptidase, partial [Acidobacteria bacterium]|nr:zinc metallopeptidase [Acidobacteriota bacterium]